jgi:hypothetical protein
VITIAIATVVLGLFFVRKISKNKEIKVEKKNAQLLSAFEGLYEVLYEAASNQTPKKTILKTLRDWNRRISLKGNVLVRKKWMQLLKAEGYSTDMSLLSSADIGKLQTIAKKWLQYVQDLGAKRDHREYLIIDSTSSILYDLEESYNNGVRAEVLIPCWTYKDSDIMLQKGSASILS